MNTFTYLFIKNISKIGVYNMNINKNKFLSLDSVLIQTSDKVINGCGFYSDDNFENYKIYNINGVLQVESE